MTQSLSLPSVLFHLRMVEDIDLQSPLLVSNPALALLGLNCLIQSVLSLIKSILMMLSFMFNNVSFKFFISNWPQACGFFIFLSYVKSPKRTEKR